MKTSIDCIPCLVRQTIFRKCFMDADLIISKGPGNYESLSDMEKNIFFLFRVKCASVASSRGLKIGTNALLTGTDRHF